MERHMPRISEVLYVGLCGIIGTPTQVKIRRDVMDTWEMIFQPLRISKGFKMMESGSYREGFRLTTSDRDNMVWNTYNIVLCDLSQIPPYHPSENLILMEFHDTPPGFAKLQLLTPPNSDSIKQSCVSVNDKVYISSSLYREVKHVFIQSHPHFNSTTLHGPCSSGYIGTLEYDSAFCFSCKTWPLPANQWIDRCQRQGWPTPQVLQDIISDGCHFVAIGSKRSNFPQQCETEWRMSFSQAEYKLVYSMNHTQFLCYGLMKIFLKEVLNVGMEDPLLCSYFMKTTLFWKIQENAVSVWCPQNILHYVWACLKYLTMCVYRGEFPNFFIQQNNMFINKIHGAAQKKLFLSLLNLYNMGFSCLLLSHTLYQIFTKAILNPQLQVGTDDNSMISEFNLDREIFTQICERIHSQYDSDLDNCFTLMKTIDNCFKTIPPTAHIHILALFIKRNYISIYIAFCLDKTRGENTYTTDSRPLEMLISAAEYGCVTDTLYVALYLYNKGHYMEALQFIERTIQKLSQPYIIDIYDGYVNSEKYMEALGGQSLLDKLRKAISCQIVLSKHCINIDELRLELCVGYGFLYVPPLVMIHMLSFLCHHHQGDRLRSRQSLDDLEILLPFNEREISWQILGICEQIYGDYERALYSYQRSLDQFPSQKMQTATLTRIRNIESKLNNDY